ncbi:MAG: hypothetical protein IPF53_21790 [Blastocatellia bacterium]|nr:hypothetical protein [Blastocatellia bacterium]
MKLHLVEPNESDGDDLPVRGSRSTRLLQVTAVVGLAGVPIAGLVGCALLLIGALTEEPAVHATLVSLGSDALYAVIPMLLLGAFSMDRLEQDRNPRGPARVDSPSRKARSLVMPTLLLAAAAAYAPTASAQQTVFNVPTTDVLDRGKVYVELDVPFKPVDPKFSSFVPRVVVGIGGNVEVGLNVVGNIQPGPDSTALAPSFKWKVYNGGDNGWAFAVGDTVTIPVRNKSYDIGNYAYAEFSKTFKSGTRVTAGGFHFSDNVVAVDAQRSGGQFAIEHPVTPRVTIAADWLTGKHAGGYFSPGVYFKPHPKVTVTRPTPSATAT